MLTKRISRYFGESKAFIRSLCFCSALVLLFAPLQLVLAAAPYITLNSFSGHAGSVQVSGGGFASGETVSLYVGSVGDVPAATVVAGKNSLFGPVSVAIPTNASQGAVQVIGVGSQSNISASNSFYVTPFNPNITVNASGNTPGSQLKISGKGFAPGENVDLSFNDSPAGSAKANARGEFSHAAVTVPSLESGTYLLHATGSSSGADTISYFFVGGFYPSASPSAYYLLPDQKLSFSGYGFAPNEDISVFSDDSLTPVASFKADSSGKFSNAGSFIIPPDYASGSKIFYLKSSVTNADIPLPVSIGKFNALVSPDRYSANPGQSVKFYGKGFSPNETIQVLWQQNKDFIPVTTIKADKNGGFAGAGQTALPFSTAGSSLAFRFVGQHSNATADTAVSVGSFNPLIAPSEYYLTPGKSFTIWGKGFAPNESVEVNAAGTSTVVSTDKFGVFKTSGPFFAPFTPNTQLPVTATGQQSGVKSTLSLAIGQLHPLIVPDSYYILPGDQVSFSGYGFAPGENVLQQNGDKNLPTIQTDKYGNFTKQKFAMPFEGGQELDFTFTGASSTAAADTTVSTSELHPLLALDNYYSTPGSTIKAQGSGFSRGEPITVTIGKSLFTTTADRNGTTPWTYVTLPMDLSAKSVQISFTGNATAATASSTAVLAPFNPQVYPSAYFTAPGTKVSFHGFGFAPHENVDILMNGQKTATSTTSVNGDLAAPEVLIPLDASSTASFEFLGPISQTDVKLNIGLSRFTPQVYPSSYYVAPGTSVTLNGYGFAPTESIGILLNQQPVGTATADPKGSFVSSKIPIPVDASKARFTFDSSATHTDVVVDVGLSAFNPQVRPSAYFGSPGSTITINGSGFAPTESVDISLNGAPAGSVTVDAKGNFVSDKIMLPFNADTARFDFSSTVTHLDKSLEVGLSPLKPSIALSSYYDAGGKPLTVTGFSFGGNEQVDLTFGDQTLGKVTTAPNGQFTLKTTVPYTASGEQNIQAIGQKSGVSASAQFTIPASYVTVRLSTYSGNPGSTVAFTGSGFTPNEQVSLTIDRGSEGAVATFDADAKGNLKNAAYKIPVELSSGPLTLTVTGQRSFAAKSIVYFVSEP